MRFSVSSRTLNGSDVNELFSTWSAFADASPFKLAFGSENLGDDAKADDFIGSCS